MLLLLLYFNQILFVSVIICFSYLNCLHHKNIEKQDPVIIMMYQAQNYKPQFDSSDQPIVGSEVGL